MMKTDPFLEKRLAVYDKWLNRRQIAYSSKVIPVTESLAAKQWVMPTEEALEILKQAGTVALQPCECRTHYGRCDHPREVCFLLDDIAEAYMKKGEARRVDLEEAAAVLQKANEHGLVHLTLYRPDHRVYALCSCCSCCCHDLQLVRKYGRPDLMVYSTYAAETNGELCIHCGECANRCPFGARVLQDAALAYNAALCTGCGLCVTVCPAGAIEMQPREPT